MSIDIVVPLTRKNTWILVLSNTFTRWRDALSMPNTTAETIAELLTERISFYLEVPG